MSELDRAKWDRKWNERAGAGAPSSFLVGAAELLPARGAALDIAAGAGRHAVWLAERGLEVTAIDISAVGLGMTRELAAARSVKVDTRCADLDDPSALPAGPWDVVLCFHYLNRALYMRMAEVLAPGGLLLICQATRSNLSRHDHPRAPFLLEDGELAGIISGLPLEVVRLDEGWSDEGRHEARLAARRAAALRR